MSGVSDPGVGVSLRQVRDELERREAEGAPIPADWRECDLDGLLSTLLALGREDHLQLKYELNPKLSGSLASRLVEALREVERLADEVARGNGPMLDQLTELERAIAVMAP